MDIMGQGLIDSFDMSEFDLAQSLADTWLPALLNRGLGPGEMSGSLIALFHHILILFFCNKINPQSLLLNTNIHTFLK